MEKVLRLPVISVRSVVWGAIGALTLALGCWAIRHLGLESGTLNWGGRGARVAIQQDIEPERFAFWVTVYGWLAIVCAVCGIGGLYLAWRMSRSIDRP